MLRVLKFEAEWCQPCRMLAPIVKNASVEHTDVEFVYIDIDEESALASQYKISAIPTMVFEKDGVEVDRVVGLVKEDLLRSKIEELK